MPSFECKSVVRVFSDAFSLALKSRHHMIVGSAFDAITSTKARLPDNVEVLLASDLVLSLSGTLDGTTISSQDLMNSAVTNHLLNYLETVVFLRSYAFTIDHYRLECRSIGDR
jgi:hypothetical protein